MFVSRFFAFALAALASASLGGALPTAENDILVKRGTPETVGSVLSVLSANLVAPTTSISPSSLSSRSPSGLTEMYSHIDTAVTNNHVSLATIQGPCNDIITYIETATLGLTGLLPGSWNGQGSMPPSYTNCVNILVVIIELLTPCLGQLLVFTTVIPEILVLLVSIDLALSTLLTTVSLLLIEVVIVVGGLYVARPPLSLVRVLIFVDRVTTVEVILQNLVFTLTLGCLGL